MVAKQSTEQNISPINPFTAALNGISVFFANAGVIAIVFAVLGIIGVFANFGQNTDSNGKNSFDEYGRQIAAIQPEQWAVIIVIGLIVFIFSLVVSVMIHGIQSYTIVGISKAEKVSLKQAFNAVLERFGGYLMLYVWMNIKIFLWSLLLIIPGIIAYYRYSFAGPLFFDDNKLKHEQAIKESNRLTKKGLLTIFASQSLFNMLTLGYMSQVVSTASLVVLYPLYKKLDADKAPKPSAHWLSWVTLALPFVLFVAFVTFLILIVVGIAVLGGGRSV